MPSQFRDFGAGVVPISGVVYFVGLAAAMLYVNMALLGRRHWAGGEQSAGLWRHALARVVAVVVAVAQPRRARRPRRLAAGRQRRGPEHALGRVAAADPQIPSDRPVFIQAFFSPDVPRDYVEAKQNLSSLLKRVRRRRRRPASG